MSKQYDYSKLLNNPSGAINNPSGWAGGLRAWGQNWLGPWGPPGQPEGLSNLPEGLLHTFEYIDSFTHFFDFR